MFPQFKRCSKKLELVSVLLVYMYLNCIGSQGVEIVATPDQNHTDFTKAIMEVSKRTQDMQVYDAMPIAL